MFIDCRGATLHAPLAYSDRDNELDEVDHVVLDEDESPVIFDNNVLVVDLALPNWISPMLIQHNRSPNW